MALLSLVADLLAFHTSLWSILLTWHVICGGQSDCFLFYCGILFQERTLNLIKRVFCNYQDDSILFRMLSWFCEQSPPVRLPWLLGPALPGHSVLWFHSSVVFRFIVSFFRICLLYFLIQQTTLYWALGQTQDSGGAQPRKATGLGIAVLWDIIHAVFALCFVFLQWDWAAFTVCWERHSPCQIIESQLCFTWKYNLCSRTFEMT